MGKNEMKVYALCFVWSTVGREYCMLKTDGQFANKTDRERQRSHRQMRTF